MAVMRSSAIRLRIDSDFHAVVPRANLYLRSFSTLEIHGGMQGQKRAKPGRWNPPLVWFDVVTQHLSFLLSYNTDIDVRSGAQIIEYTSRYGF